MVSLTNFRSVGELDTQNQLSKLAKTADDRHHLTISYGGGADQTTNAVASNNNLAHFQQLDLQSNPKKYNINNHQQHHHDHLSAIEDKPLFDKSANSSISDSTIKTKDHFEIRWSNLTYEVEPKWYKQSLNLFSSSAQTSSSSALASVQSPAASSGKTSILDSLNGSVKSGQVTAILGPSGAGKTSLLGCLTGKNKTGVSGTVEIISNRNEPMSICTIPQKDYLLNQLTVRENLWFASRLKHPEEIFDHDSNINRVVALLKLEVCIDTKISKISGGQYKRVSIAQELLSNPDILILDEPTSGLDSLTCYKTVMVLRDLARLSPNPMAIIVTIHQPQREVFDLFNHVYILAVGGRCIYEGQPSESIKTINESSGGLHFDADQYNPASYLVEIASSEFGQKPIEALVENQRREFARRTLEADQNQAAHNVANGMPAAGTPGLKKRQSPMIARFKSTLSSLTGTGSAGGNSPRLPDLHRQQLQLQQQQQLQLQLQQQQLQKQQQLKQQQPHMYAYTNEAYETSQMMNGQQQLAAPKQLDVAQIETIDATGQQQQHYRQPQPPATNKQQQTNVIMQSTREQLLTTSSGKQIEEGSFYLDERLQTHKHNHKGHFLRHCQLLTKRSWLCLCKDPMLTTLRFSAHIIVPLLITVVYGSRVGKPNACPLYESEMDLIDYARQGAKRLLNLQDELRCTFENVGLYFLSIYAFTFSTMCLTSLSFPLNMHVLLKEVRNGWYSIPTYFIGKTLADFPLEFILPTLTLMITYPLTGQPSSYMEWRFLLATGIFVITSLIAQTQGLIFGALFMNAMQAAVFVAPVSTTPLILLSGFLIRISQMPVYLQRLSSLSYFRYAIESLTIIRYGFGQCPCDPEIVNGQPVSAAGVPDQLRTMTNYWLSTFNEAAGNDTLLLSNGTELATTTNPEAQVDFFQDLTVLLARANSFGADIKTCDDLKPYPMIDFTLRDEQLYVWVGALVATLFLSKVVNYLVVKYSVKWRL